MATVYYGMNTASTPTLFPDAATDTRHARTPINPLLWFEDCDGYRVIFCRHEILYRVALKDAHHLAIVAVTLRQSKLTTQTEIATAFGHAVATQRRWETRFSQYGSDGLLPRTPTGRPAKLDRGQQAFVRRWFHEGVGNREMARRLAVSETTIRRLLQQAGLQRPTTPAAELPLADAAFAPAVATAATVVEAAAPATECLTVAAWDAAVPVLGSPAAATPPSAAAATAAAASAEATPAAMPAVAASAGAASAAPASAFTLDHDPADRSGDRFLARQGLLEDAAPLFGDHAELPRAGVLLAVPVLQAHGALEVFRRLYGSLGAAFYGLRTTVLSLILLALLRIKRPENLKEYSPESLGRLLGLDRMAEVKTLRRKLTLLAERRQGHELLNELARLRLAQDEDRVAFLYVDGHVREYSGQEVSAR